MGDESQALQDQQDGEEALEHMRWADEDRGIHVTDSDDARLHFTIRDMLDRYVAAKAAKVGTQILCPCCGKRLTKRSYQHKFCNTRCKDQYWNTVDDTRRERAITMR